MARRHPPSVAAGMKAMGIVVEDVPAKGRGKKKKAARERRGLKRAARKLQAEQREQKRAEAKAAAESGRAVRLRARDGTSPAAMAAGTGTRYTRGGLMTAPAAASALDVAPSDGVPVEGAEGPGPTAASQVHAPPQRAGKRAKLTAAEKLAYTMFDTAEYAGVSSNPFSDESALRSATVTELPQELFFLLRTLQIMRGICHATDNNNFSIVRAWAPAARQALHVARKSRSE